MTPRTAAESSTLSPPYQPNYQYGRTPLHAHAEEGRIDGVRALIRAGSKVNAACISADLGNGVRGWTPLHFAAFKGWRRATMLLLRAGADAAAECAVRVCNVCTPLHGWLLICTSRTLLLCRLA